MGGRRAVLAAIVVCLAAGLLVWRLGGRPPAGEPASALPAVTEGPTEPKAQEPPPSAPADEPAATMSAAFDDLIDELPEPVDLSATLIPILQNVEETAPDCAELVAAWKEKMGWDRLETIEFTLSGEMGLMGTVTSKVTVEYPLKWLNVFTFEVGSWKQEYYQLSDGVFLEMGRVNAEGARAPMNFGRFGGPDGATKPTITPELLTYEAFSFQEAVDFVADPSDPMFQKADGSPLDNLNLTMLTSNKDEGTYNVFVDPQSGRAVGFRLFDGEDLHMECIGIEYDQIAEGITYPVGLTLRVLARRAWGEPQWMEVGIKMSDFTVNEPLAPETFHFTSK